MKAVVIDASLAMAFLMSDEVVDEEIERAITDNEIKMYVPPVFESELFNGILTAYRRDRLTWRESILTISTYERLLVEEKRIDLTEVMKLARKHGLTFYDASYVWLARKLKVELLTGDKKMREVVWSKAHN